MARGTVRQRSKVRKDSWTVQVYTGVDPKTGKKHYHSEAVKGTKALAQRRLTELLREVDTGTFVEPIRLTVAKYFEQWLRDHVLPVAPWRVTGATSTATLVPSWGEFPLKN